MASKKAARKAETLAKSAPPGIPAKPTKKAKPKSPTTALASEVKDSPSARRAKFGNFPSENATLPVSARVIPVPRRVAYARAEIAMQRNLEELKKLPGFQFADVGYKFMKGEITDHLAVRLHVREKSPGHTELEKLFENQLVFTDVVVSKFRKAASLTDAGSRITSSDNPKYGTLGMGVNYTLQDVPFFLTCAHVVSEFDPPTSAESFISNASGDVGFSDNFNPDFYRYDSEFDLALLLPPKSIPDADLGKFVSNLPLAVSAPMRISPITESDLNTVVYKIGANTPRLSKGYIDAVNPTAIPIEDSPDAVGHFIVRSTPTPGLFAPIGGGFANFGDSGAIVFTDDGRILGMVRAVSHDNNDAEADRTVITRMSRIREEFKVDV